MRGYALGLPLTRIQVTDVVMRSEDIPCVVTSLTGNQPYYMRGGLIPHLTRKGSLWKSQAPAFHNAVLKLRLHIDAVNSAHLDTMEKIVAGASSS